ncbi:MAG: fibronectin type III domain-containing protein, partial [Chloroflexi bacterium]|nr:fibronectin type III domain-containing protein [Chloroflexota bacterium]
GSEVARQANPLWPGDDRVRPLGIINYRPINQGIVIGWSYPLSYTIMTAYVSTDMNSLGNPVDMGSSGDFTIPNLTNDTPYYIRIIPGNGADEGPITQPVVVTPKSDPDAPAGWMLINNDAATTTTRAVTLNISASDTPLPGAAESANAHQTDMLSMLVNDVSGNVEMRIANSPDMSGATWQTLAAEAPWTLTCKGLTLCPVYIQFRDGAGNESLVIYDDIFLDVLDLYLPVILRN